MARKAARFGQPAVYNASPPALVDGDDSALNVDASGNLKVTATASGTTEVTQGTTPWVVDTELPAAAALTDTNANPTTSIVGSALLGYNGTNFPRMRTASATQNVDGTRSLGVGIAAHYDDTATGTVSEDNIALVRMTPSRELAVTARMLPVGATQVNAASGNVANASAAATLAGVSGKTTYITGFEITAGGATAAAIVNPTVTGTLGGTLTYSFGAPAGATVVATPLIVNFSTPIPASSTNTAIVVTLPALGAGNTNATVVARGFQV